MSRSSIDMIEVSVDFAVKINAYLSYEFNFSYVCGECSYSFGLVNKSKFLYPFYFFFILTPGTNLSNLWVALFRSAVAGSQMHPLLSQTVRFLSVSREREFTDTQCQVINPGFIQSRKSPIKCNVCKG